MLSGGLFECSLEGRIAAPRVTTQNWVNIQIDTAETPHVTRSRKQHALFFSLPLTVFACLCTAPPLLAETRSEFIAFPQATFNFNNKDVPSIEQRGSDVAVDFFYTAEFGDARVLAEFFVDNEEREMERLAVGWSAALP